MIRNPSRRFTVVVPAILDVVAVVVFVIAGRAFHTEALDLVGVLETGWPFLVGLALGWALTRAWRSPWLVVRPGIGIWVVTVAVGMMLRFVASQGVQLSFIIVTVLVLALLLLGWRLVAKLIRPGARMAS